MTPRLQQSLIIQLTVIKVDRAEV